MQSLVLLAIAACFAACGQSSSNGATASRFWDTDEDVHGAPGLWVNVIHDPEQIMTNSDAVAVVTVTGFEGHFPGPLTEPVILEGGAESSFKRGLDASANTPTDTTYTATVKEWIKGTGETQVEINGMGGWALDGTPIIVDGTFLLEPGRTYLLALLEYGDGPYIMGGGRSGFDMTDGVKVLNHPDTRDLEHYEQMSTDEFISYIDSLAKD